MTGCDCDLQSSCCFQTIKNPDQYTREDKVWAHCESVAPWDQGAGNHWVLGFWGFWGQGQAARAHPTTAARRRAAGGSRAAPAPGIGHLPGDRHGLRSGQDVVLWDGVRNRPGEGKEGPTQSQDLWAGPRDSTQWTQTHWPDESCRLLWPGHNLGGGESAWIQGNGRAQVLVLHPKRNQALRAAYQTKYKG